jgi:hypothetical protein
MEKVTENMWQKIFLTIYQDIFATKDFGVIWKIIFKLSKLQLHFLMIWSISDEKNKL